MTQHLNSKTMPDFFGERYESKALKITASAIVFIFLVPYTASVYNGLSRLFGKMCIRDRVHGESEVPDGILIPTKAGWMRSRQQ